MKKLRLILGDQLNLSHSWYDQQSDDIQYVMMEIRPESEYVTHHIQKIVGVFMAMRAFAAELRSRGHQVHYFRIDDDDNKHSFADNMELLCRENDVALIEYQEPDEYRLDELLRSDLEPLVDRLQVVSTEHFYTEREELADFFSGKKQYLMESFYRSMRRKHNVLMDGDQPVTGKWNYDHSNRKKLPKKIELPSAYTFTHDARTIVDALDRAGLRSIGTIEAECFTWPITRDEAHALLDHFIDHLLPYFGLYQDALTSRGWSLFHSLISFAMNIKLISPQYVVTRVEQAWRDDPERVSIAQAEGYIRQILGWREYMRGVYWAQMPEYAEKNYFEHNRPLPEWYWTGDTRMQCLSHSISQSLEHAYAHHIQRLMVTGNFALLTGVHPDEIDQWYLGIYIDAFEWVEITNTRGMSQYADGGIVGTKPYVSSGSYINKMSDYCGQCHYSPKVKIGEKACPFNSLYWHFLDLHREKLARNPRMSMMYRVWDKMEDSQADILSQARYYLDNIETL